MRTLVTLTMVLVVSVLVCAQTAAPAPAAPPKAEEPQGYTYNPEGRRDPFVSLLRRGAEPQKLPAGARPAGLAGLAASEVTLKGTLQGRDGFVGLLQGSDNKSYLVRPGDKLLDGVIRTITADSLVIVQQVNDPLSLQKTREVRKAIRQTVEAK
jgi:Tfp pilus assembly protein PilP